VVLRFEVGILCPTLKEVLEGLGKIQY
jgi:hypothetical protein